MYAFSFTACFLHHSLTLCSLISSVVCLIQPAATYFIMLSAGATRTQQSEYSAALQSTTLHSPSFNTLIGRELLLCSITVVFDGQVGHVLLCDPGVQLIQEAFQQWMYLEHDIPLKLAVNTLHWDLVVST